ncbi:MAG: Preprotein translocase subunit SecB [Lachnospiraceae bacterium]|jgi:preprotein translocase subunit SecB|nr:Preprotein translocase subunit SecB [Lachnospiraceae bacterium]
MSKEVGSALCLDKLVFDKIEFKRTGMKNESEIEFNLGIAINKKQDEEIYKVTLSLNGNKEKEYTLEIILSGYFSFDDNEKTDDKLKRAMINQNAVAIIMPYLRSQVSLVTAQPEVDCVVLPPFNIIKMMSED